MKSSGFTLIELMIVIGIIAIIAAIAIPNLVRSRLQSNEAAAIGNLRTLLSSQTAFASAESGYAGDYADLRDNPIADGSPAYIDVDLLGVGGVLQGYRYEMAGDGDSYAGATVASVFRNYISTAMPTSPNQTGIRAFRVDASGVIRQTADGSEPAADSTPI